ncbi:hypothetical protein [Propionimicrobium sp. PCR01-08-3]|uniref:coiled-coil domain-containing protein n=1 Tax=Propionimicrobium sp. PCR01-08-3 TaxID=3052086 RepID=UPI00255CB0AF|nr:hypothetical protein [Propionimicrobium sp. PCR01-08-3]WIY83172.1 hypothetical protein QQ658_02090 [Propionimicrobium sp. PCR01-08-3]
MIRDLPRYSNSAVRSTRRTWRCIVQAIVGAGVAVALSIGPATANVHADELDDQYEQVQAQVDAQAAEVGGHQSEWDAANGVLQQSQSELADAQAVLASAQSAEASAQQKSTEAAQALQTATENLTAAQSDVDDAQVAVDEQQKKVGLAVQQETQQNKSLTAVGLLFSNMSTSDLNNQLQWTNNAMNSIQNELDVLNAALDDLEVKRDAMASAQQDAQLARDTAVAQFEEAQQTSLTALDAANQVAEKVAASQSALDAVQQILDQALAQDSELRQRASDLAGQIQARDDAAAAAAAAAAGASAAGWVAAQSSWVTANIAPGQIQPFSVEQAVAQAEAMNGNMNYGDMCLALVAAFYGYSSSGVNSATDAANIVANAGQMQYDTSAIPVGALVFYDGTPAGNPFGHIAMYAGNGMIYSNGAANGGVGMISLDTPSSGWGEPLIGWSSVWLPYATA